LSQAPVAGAAAWLAAVAPVVLVLALLLAGRGGARSGAAGWVVAMLIAALLFGAGPLVLVVSQAKALLMSAFVLYIIWLAIAFHHVVRESGALDAIAAGVARHAVDPTLQLLVLAWVFASFLQGVTGFGVPVAVVAPLLMGLGFHPVTSVVAASLGHGWAVTFGSLASSFHAMLAVTGLPGAALAPWSALFLGLACLPSGLLVLWVHDGPRGVRHGAPAVLLIGVAMGAAQFLLASRGLYPVAAFGAGLVGLGVAALVTRLPRHRGPGPLQPAVPAAGASAGAARGMGLAEAMSGYAVLLVVVLVGTLSGPLARFLGRVVVDPDFPATSTALGWSNPAGPGQAIAVFSHPGALILYACLAAFLLYAARGRYGPGAARRVAGLTWHGAGKPTAAILFLVGMAAVMSDSGMTFTLAGAVGRVTGPLYPFVAPFIGALGAFVTGSNTNSNVLFARLQQDAAALLGLDPRIILGAQNLGGAVGSTFAPAKIIVACSTAWAVLQGREGTVLRLTLAYGLVIIALGGVVALVAAALV